MLRAIQRLWCGCRARKEKDSEGSDAPEPLVEKNYEIGEVIGQGRLGMVHICTDNTTGEQFACKKMPMTKNAYDEMLLLETRLSGKHPGILKVRACYWGQWLAKYGWSKNLYMISELCDGGDLQRLLERNGIPSERESARTMKCIVEALRYCHSQSIIHRDVKPSSIFISNTANSGSSWVVKLGNFDRSIQLHNGKLEKYSSRLICKLYLLVFILGIPFFYSSLRIMNRNRVKTSNETCCIKFKHSATH
jgi:serine/threonine protein kinase